MNIQRWSSLHKWSSLICTVFLLMLCITGLPLIFHDEIDEWMGEVHAPGMPAATPMADLDKIAAIAQRQRPDDVIRFMSWNEAESPNLTFVIMAKSMDAPPEESVSVTVDSRTAKVLDSPEPSKGIIYFLFFLHSQMFLGLPGMLLLGFMGLMFAVAIVSGMVLYMPFMRRLDFGTVRRSKGTRTKWLDVHNLLGVATLTWALVVGVTGSINTLNKVIIGIWQKDQMADMVAPYLHAPPIQHLGSLQAAVNTAKKTAPDMHVGFVAYPGSRLSSPHHFTVFMRGDSPVTSRLVKPVLVDAETGKLTDSRDLPWYAKVLLLSQPLHFGDYAGLPLKVIWALLDVVTIMVLISGLYLWYGKHKSKDGSMQGAIEQ